MSPSVLSPQFSQIQQAYMPQLRTEIARLEQEIAVRADVLESLLQQQAALFRTNSAPIPLQPLSTAEAQSVTRPIKHVNVLTALPRQFRTSDFQAKAKIKNASQALRSLKGKGLVEHVKPGVWKKTDNVVPLKRVA